MRLLASLLTLLLVAPCAVGQAVTVETVVPPGSEIDDALALGPDGALYGSRFGTLQPYVPGQTVTRVDLSDGSTSVYARGFSSANGLAFRPNGTLYVANYYDAGIDAGHVSRVSASGSVQHRLAEAGARVTISGAAFDAVNNRLYVTSYDNNWIKHMTASGSLVDVVVGDRRLDGPAGLAFDSQNRLHVANYNNGKIYRVDGSDLVLLADLQRKVGFLAYGGGRFFATAIDAHRVYAITEAGEVSILAGTGAPGTDDGPGTAATFNRPNGIVATASGDTLYVSDAGSRAVRRIVIGGATSAEAAPSEAEALLPVAPNPVAAETTVRFHLDAPADVDVALYDTLGRRVRDLASGPHAAGPHRLGVDTATLAPGAYRIVLRRDGAVESQPFVRR
ncbi:MAG: hypothetical protein AAF845_01105 [Bacteroidota bacterium]